MGPYKGNSYANMDFTVCWPSRRSTVFRQNRIRQLNVELALVDVANHNFNHKAYSRFNGGAVNL
jgi:hypothetical protein